MKTEEMIGHFLPEGLLDYFEIKKVVKGLDHYLIELEERNIKPEQYCDNKLTSKGFYDSVRIQDFPLRGKACYLDIKRRRWTNEDTGEIVSRDWSIVSQGSRITAEFAAFLKEFVRQQPVSINSVGSYFCINGKRLEHHYVSHLSGFVDWDQREHASDWVLHEKNLGSHLSIDEVALSQGELYTVLTNKSAKGGKGALIAMVKGTDSKYVGSILLKMKSRFRNKVKEITLDMAPSMQKIVSICFPKAVQVTDRFHVQKLAVEALQDIRVEHRWEAIEQENKEIELCKENGKNYISNKFDNGDTLRQLLVRSRYLLFKSPNNWTPSQRHRAEILFRLYPDIEHAYKLTRALSNIYQTTKNKGVAFTKLARWYEKVEKSGFKTFNTVIRTLKNNYLTILNYFDNRSTNASAESFNAKIKAFRSQFRGVRSIPFFLFRLSKIYA